MDTIQTLIEQKQKAIIVRRTGEIMKNKPCKKTFCKSNYAHYPKLKRYGEKCMNPNTCAMLEIAQQANVINILDRPIKEGYKYLQELTEKELEYCIHAEKRAGGLAKLQAEKRHRTC